MTRSPSGCLTTGQKPRGSRLQADVGPLPSKNDAFSHGSRYSQYKTINSHRDGKYGLALDHDMVNGILKKRVKKLGSGLVGESPVLPAVRTH